MATASVEGAADELIIDSPIGKSIRVRLELERYRLGRSAVNELSFPRDESLSREHLVFERQPEGWTVRDVGSRNGTRVNGVRIAEAVRLAHGDRISAGRLNIRYDARKEFANSKLDDILFVDEESATSAGVETVSVNLKSALQTSTDVAGRPTLESTHLGALVRAGRELAGHCPLEKLFQIVLDLSLDAVKAARGVVMTLEADGSLKTRAMRGDGLRISTSVRDRVVGRGESLLVRDASVDQYLAQRQSIVAQQIRSILAVPLQTDERVIGLIYVDSPFLIREFNVEDLNLVTVMANQAAIRIEHARLIEVEQARKLLDQELARAAEIQRRFLPDKAPDIAGFDVAGYNAPCRTVGGDYYDFLRYPDGRIALLIGDVSGKGMAAALLMSSLQARAQVLFSAPGELATQISELNRITSSSCPSNCFITFFIALLEPATGEILYCNAGHNAPLLLHSSGEVESLGATGTVLGIRANAEYEHKRCRLEQGDVLVLFSDGVTEAARPDTEEEFGEKHLVAFIQEHRNHTAKEILDGINTEILAFTGGAPPADDVTLVVACRLWANTADSLTAGVKCLPVDASK
jgi:phosphoserine phosphatase RsbU/P